MTRYGKSLLWIALPAGLLAGGFQGGPLGLWGVQLDAAFDSIIPAHARCMSGAEFAHIGGAYSPIADAVIMGAPHQHEDSTLVLRNLEPARVCFLRVDAGATAIVTGMGGKIVNAIFFWPDGGGPSPDSVAKIITHLYGPPRLNSFGTPVWSRDSSGIYLAPRGPYWRGTTVSLNDWRASARYEEAIHGSKPPVVPPDSVTNPPL